MKTTSLLAIAAAFVFAGCATPPPADTAAAPVAFTAIETEEAFRSAIVGRTFEYADGSSLTISADGTFEGEFGDGSPAAGTWDWEDRFYCRRYVVETSVRNCRTVEIAGDRVRYVRDRGTGSVEVVTLTDRNT